MYVSAQGHSHCAREVIAPDWAAFELFLTACASATAIEALVLGGPEVEHVVCFKVDLT